MEWDDARPKKKPAHELGADLAVLSVSELEDYLAVLAAERQRVNDAGCEKGYAGGGTSGVQKINRSAPVTYSQV